MTMIPNDADFRRQRQQWRSQLASDTNMRSASLDLQMATDRYRFGYHFDWLGVPIIRFPDDILVFQEIVFTLKPNLAVEVGVARGGGALLAASLMSMCSETPRVLGLDIDIQPHCQSAISNSAFSHCIELHEVDSSSPEAKVIVEEAVRLHSPEHPVVMTLDSNHTHKHVLAELTNFTPILPPGSVVVVADAIIEECPEGHFPNRPWGPGNSPKSALDEFLGTVSKVKLDERWCRRGVLTECRDSIIVITDN